MSPHEANQLPLPMVLTRWKRIQTAPDQSHREKDTHITAVEGELQKVWGTVSHHVLESVIVQPEILWMGMVGWVQGHG